MRRAITLLAACLWFVSAMAEAPQPWQAKVAPRVWADLEKGDADFLVVLAEQADLSGAAGLSSKEEKGAFVVRRLRETAERTQGPLVTLLRGKGAEVQPFWAANFLKVRGGYEALEAAAGRSETARVEPNPLVRAVLPELRTPSEGRAPEAARWNITLTKADQVWARGFAGQGVVLAGQDTGYRWTHAALLGKYRGWNGTAADHNYSWHDAIHSGGGSCGANALTPCDDYGHGTHTMGTMVGDDGVGNSVGMAPGAKWIGCRNMNVGYGTPATYAECFQWFLAPTDLSGANPDPANAPDVTNNSWGCPPSEGCTDVDVLRTVTENCRAAGIVVVASAGNAGSSCSTVEDPPAIYAASFSVAATDNSDAAAYFSSRGPVTVDGSNRPKPEISAPGVAIYSTTRISDTSFGYMDGTSMAGPHVAGLVALLLSARPDLRGRVDSVVTLIEKSAAPLYDATCGASPGGIPNNTYGYGRIDALAMLDGDADSDGTANFADCDPTSALNPHPTAARELRLAGSATTVLTWDPPASPGGTLVTYTALRSLGPAPADFASATPLEPPGETDRTATDASLPSSPGEVLYYLVRATNTCGSDS